MELELRPLEIELLSYLIANKGRILSHEQIYINVWGNEYANEPRGTLWSHISKLRRKLRDGTALPDFIKTERGIGYGIEK